MGNGKDEKAAMIGDLKVTMCNKQGVMLGTGMIRDVVHLPTECFNLFSVTKLVKDGWTLGGDKSALWLTKGNVNLNFDIIIPTSKGMIFTMYVKHKGEMAGVSTDTKVKMTIQQAHSKMGHANKYVTRKTAKILGFELKPGSLNACEACAAAKAKQKNVPKESSHVPAKTNNERIYLDIAAIKAPSHVNVTKPNWHIMVDERTQINFLISFQPKMLWWSQPVPSY